MSPQDCEYARQQKKKKKKTDVEARFSIASWMQQGTSRKAYLVKTGETCALGA
jgi:hypothetical protein